MGSLRHTRTFSPRPLSFLFNFKVPLAPSTTMGVLQSVKYTSEIRGILSLTEVRREMIECDNCSNFLTPPLVPPSRSSFRPLPLSHSFIKNYHFYPVALPLHIHTSCTKPSVPSILQKYKTVLDKGWSKFFVAHLRIPGDKPASA